jgi:hypothetical protein
MRGFKTPQTSSAISQKTNGSNPAAPASVGTLYFLVLGAQFGQQQNSAEQQPRWWQ